MLIVARSAWTPYSGKKAFREGGIKDYQVSQGREGLGGRIGLRKVRKRPGKGGKA